MMRPAAAAVTRGVRPRALHSSVDGFDGAIARWYARLSARNSDALASAR
jgi:hypothetical protein